MYLKETLNKIKSQEALIEIVGLGYVGFPLSVRLASSGWKVIGVDTNVERIERLKNSELKETEINLKEKFLESYKKGNLVLSENFVKSKTIKVGIICVPTPITKNNIQSDMYVKSSVENFLKTSNAGDIIIIESSIEVGTIEKIKKIIESAGFKVGENFGLSYCPERIDPSNKKWRLENIPRIIYCSDNITFEIAQKIYAKINKADLVRVYSSKIAEVVKSFENAFRLVNISLVNELAILCDKLKIDVNEVIKAASTKPFGFTPFYPGSGAGGHCIPKDPIFLSESAKNIGWNFSTIENALIVNSFIPKYIVDSIENIVESKKIAKNILVVGLTYKPDVEDMRDSPSFKIINELNRKKFQVFTYDLNYKKDLKEKYLFENNLKSLDFIELDELSDQNLEKISCMCIVQFHSKNKSELIDIYERGLIPLIYDCQGRLERNDKSNSILIKFGGN